MSGDGNRWLDRRDVLVLWAWAEGEMTDAEAARALGVDCGCGWSEAYPLIEKIVGERRKLVAALKDGAGVLALMAR